METSVKIGLVVVVVLIIMVVVWVSLKHRPHIAPAHPSSPGNQSSGTYQLPVPPDFSKLPSEENVDLPLESFS